MTGKKKSPAKNKAAADVEDDTATREETEIKSTNEDSSAGENKKRKIEISETETESMATNSCGGASHAKYSRPINEAQWWYYLDAEEKKQGPQYPGSMRSWYDQGFFDENTKVAPSFMGEIPKKDGFLSVKETFQEPYIETVFAAKDGIALYPPEQVAPVIYDIPDEEAPEQPQRGQAQWLEDKLQDKRRGKVTYLTGAPVLKGSFIN